MTDIEKLIKDLKQAKLTYELNSQVLDKITKTKEASKTEVNTKLNEKSQYEALIKATKLILEKLTDNSLGKLERFLSYGLQQIFTDKHYAVKLVLREDTKRPGVEFILLENEVEQEITDAVGGGIISTLGLLAQIYYIELYKLNKIMFIDEGLVAISKSDEEETASINYLNNVLKFLNFMAKERDYRFVIVTHDTKVQEFADSVYKIKHGCLEKVV